MTPEKPRPRPARASKGILLLLAAFACLAATYSVVTPLFEASDELSHYPLVKHLADGGSLPVQDPANPGPWLQEGSQPPLYYWLAAQIVRLVPAGDPFQLLQPNPHADIGYVRPDGNANMVVHTSAEAFPYQGTALAIHLVRGFSVLLGAVTVLFTYLIGLQILPRRPGLALAGAALVAFTPMFLFISGSVNNDNLVIALATVCLWLVLRLLRRPALPGWALLGVLVGLAALSKVSGLGLLGLAGLALAWSAWRRRDWQLFFLGGTCVVGAAAAVAGWWYVRNWQLYGDPLGFNMMVAIAGARPVRLTLPELLGEWPGFIKAYWGVFGGMNVVPPEWFYRLCDASALLAVAGLAAGAIDRLRRRAIPDTGAATRLALAGIWPLIIAAGLVRWTLLTPASQGRLMFPALASLSYLLVLGWAELARTACCVLRSIAQNGIRSLGRDHASRITHYVVRSTQYAVALAPIVLMATLAVWIPFGVIAPAYARPPLLTPAEQAAIPQRLDLAVGDQMELLGYRLDRSECNPGDELRLTVYWRAKAPTDKNYSVYVHLLDQNEMKIAQRDVYPGRGLFPTSLWQGGDAIADTYVITVPANTFRPNRLALEVGLYVLGGDQPLLVRDREGRELGRSVRLGDVRVPAAPQDRIANPVDFNLGNQVALLGYDLDRVALRAGETARLTLYWQDRAPESGGYTAYAHILGPDGALWAGKASPLPAGVPKGQVVQGTYDLALRADTPPGDYYVDAGLYPAGTGQSLSVLDRWGHAVDRRALLTRIRVLPAAPQNAAPQSVFPPIQHPLDVTFGDVARLRGYSLECEALNPHEPIPVTLYWEAINGEPLLASYKVFVHLVDAQGRLLGQHDGLPALGLWPTTSWTRGQAIVDRHDVVIQDGGYAGPAHLLVGLYEEQSVQRISTAAGDDKVLLPVDLRVAP